MSQNLFKIYDGRDHFWQWDTGQKLIVLNNDVDQVHFSNNKMTYAIVKEVFTDSDGTRICEVPDVILKTPNSLIAYAYVIEEDQNRTIDAIKYSVHSRQAPEDYTYEENNRFKDLVNKIGLIEDALEKVTDVKKFDTIEEAEQWAMESNEVGRVITINIDSKWTAYMVDSDHSVSKVHDNSDLIEYIDNLSKLIGNESVSDQIKNAIEALDLSNTYASKSHNHTKDDITDFAHTHEITDVNGLHDALDGKQPAGDYALKSDIKEAPVQSVNGQTGNVEITVDSIGALPNTTKIPSIEGLASEEYVDNKIAAIPTPDVSGQIEVHNTSIDAHSELIQSIKNYADERMRDAHEYSDKKINELVESGAAGGMESQSITWDGNTEGLTSFTIEDIGMTFYRVSAKLIPPGEIKITIENWKSIQGAATEMLPGFVSLPDLVGFSAKAGEYGADEDIIVVPESGTYFMKNYNIYPSSVSYETIHPIDPKFLPDTVATDEDVNIAMQEAKAYSDSKGGYVETKVLTNDGNNEGKEQWGIDSSRVYRIGDSIDLNTVTKVTGIAANGVEMSVTAADMVVGHFVDYDCLEANGIPFVFVLHEGNSGGSSAGTYVYSNPEGGVVVTRVETETIHPIDHKYLPDTVPTKTYVNEQLSSYISATIIDNVLVVASNVPTTILEEEE